MSSSLHAATQVRFEWTVSLCSLAAFIAGHDASARAVRGTRVEAEQLSSSPQCRKCWTACTCARLHHAPRGLNSNINDLINVSRSCCCHLQLIGTACARRAGAALQLHASSNQHAGSQRPTDTKFAFSQLVACRAPYLPRIWETIQRAALKAYIHRMTSQNSTAAHK